MQFGISSLSCRRGTILACCLTLTFFMQYYIWRSRFFGTITVGIPKSTNASRALERTAQATGRATKVAPSGTALKSLNLSIHFEPDHVRSTTCDIVINNGTMRIFSPGRLQLRSLCSSVTLNACSVNAIELHFILSEIRAFIVANNTPQCLDACKVQLPVPHLICPEALLSFRLPNSLLLPAGAQQLQIPGIEFKNGGLRVTIGAANCKIMSIATSSSDVVVMQVNDQNKQFVFARLRTPRRVMFTCSSHQATSGPYDLHIRHYGGCALKLQCSFPFCIFGYFIPIVPHSPLTSVRRSGVMLTELTGAFGSFDSH